MYSCTLYLDDELAGCGYDVDYKYAATNSYVDAMQMTGVNASIYWESFPSLKQAVAMACTVSINNQFIYVIGGFVGHNPGNGKIP